VGDHISLTSRSDISPQIVLLLFCPLLHFLYIYRVTYLYDQTGKRIIEEWSREQLNTTNEDYVNNNIDWYVDTRLKMMRDGLSDFDFSLILWRIASFERLCFFSSVLYFDLTRLYGEREKERERERERKKAKINAIGLLYVLEICFANCTLRFSLYQSLKKYQK